MAQASIIQDGIDRVEHAVRNFEKDWKRLQQRAEKRRREFERRAERRVRRLRAELRKNPAVKRAEAWRHDVTRVLEEQVETLLAGLRIASQGDVEKLERKVGQLNRKVRELEKNRSNAAA